MHTLVEPTLETSTLSSRDGHTVYHCAIEPAGERFVVNFAYGRRGSTLNTGTRTNVPVDYDHAKRRFDQLVRELQSKGYRPEAQPPGGAEYATALFVVAQVNRPRRVEVRLLGEDGWMPCANVPIPAHHPIPKVGQVVAVRYRFAHRETHALYQPVYQGLRPDVGVAECRLAQLQP